jgi:hypothetical protein
VALDQGRHTAAMGAYDQISFPVAGNRPVLHRRWSLTDRDGIGHTAQPMSLQAGLFGPSDGSPGAQILLQLLLLGATGLDKEAAIDRLV